jgi:hypothetical protein
VTRPSHLIVIIVPGGPLQHRDWATLSKRPDIARRPIQLEDGMDSSAPVRARRTGVLASSSIHTATVTLERGCRGRGGLAQVPGGQRPGHPGLTRDSEHWHHDASGSGFKA